LALPKLILPSEKPWLLSVKNFPQLKSPLKSMKAVFFALIVQLAQRGWALGRRASCSSDEELWRIQRREAQTRFVFL